MNDQRPIRRALISVYDKTGLEELAGALAAEGVDIVSTGSTAARIEAAGASVTPVEELTGFPECLEGRVKTLHPKVHAGILADSRKEDHLAQLKELGVEQFDLVVVNLYPFVETVASGAGYDDVVEQIDIGGPSMVRAAAKNHPTVAVVTDPSRYDDVIAAVKGGGFDFAQRRELAKAAFEHTAAYDVAVAAWFGQQLGSDDAKPDFFGMTAEKKHDLRYGENPHQKAAVYASPGTGGVANAVQHGGKEMSYNNYVDTDAALRAAYDHAGPAVAIIKHANPCGIATADTIAEAHRLAHATDSLSAYGGVIACNRKVDLATAESIKPIFTEVVIAPGYDEDALELLQTKKNLRILEVDGYTNPPMEYRQVTGGILVQDRDEFQGAGDSADQWTLAAGKPVDDATLADLEFAWKSCRAVKSNAILLASGGAAVGVGMGQVNRVDSAKLAVERAGAERAEGSVAASDAFFPFADGLQVLIDGGVKAVVQPGGSIRDEEVIEAAEAAGISMYFTGTRHFFH